MEFASLQAMNWDDLRVFAVIAESGSLQGAARTLGVNHSTVFRRLNRFEKDIGVRLFERMPTGYVLTQAGEELGSYAARISAEMDAMQLKIAGRDFQPRGTIRLTAPDNIAFRYLPDHLEAFRKLYPDISLEFVVGGQSLDLTRREADIALRATTKPSEHLVGRKVCSLTWSFYAAKKYLKENDRPARQEELVNHRLIAGDGPMLRLPAMRFVDQNWSTSVVARCNTLNAMASLAIAGYGIAALPSDQDKPGLKQLFELEPRIVSDLWILTHPELRHTERIKLLMTHLLTALRNDKRLRQIR